jgi:AbiV family abortive infection protein
MSASLITLGGVDANAVRTADRRVLVGYAAAVAKNARDLLADAELLLEAGRWARAYSLAALADEEWAKAYAVLTLSFTTPAQRERIPVRDFLGWHRLKMMGAVLLRVFDGARPGVAGRVAGTSDLAGVLRGAEQQAVDDDAAKQRGLYADLLANGTLSLPSDVSESEAQEAVARARETGVSAALLHDREALAGFADPPAEALVLAEALFARLLEAKGVSDADGAAAWVGDMAARLAAGNPPPEA